MKTIEWTSPSWTRSSLAHDQAIKWREYAYTQIPSYDWSKFQILQKQIEDGKVKCNNFNKPVLTVNYFEMMEHRLCSGGMFSQDMRPWRSSRQSRKTCKIETLNVKSLKIESSSYQCSMTSNGQRKEIQKMYFKFLTSKELREEILSRTLDIPPPWRRTGMVWN